MSRVVVLALVLVAVASAHAGARAGTIERAATAAGKPAATAAGKRDALDTNHPSTLAAVAATYDAGTVEVGAPIRHTYELRNTGTKPLQITVRPSCGCTTTDFDPAIPPGGIGHVSASLDTKHLRGSVAKRIQVTTDDPGSRLELIIRARVVGVLDVLPTEEPTLHGRLGALTPIELTVAAPSGEAFAITTVEDDPRLRATVAPADPASPTGGHQRYRLTLTPKADLGVGRYQPVVTLVTTAPKAERFILTPTIIVTGPLGMWPLQFRVRDAAHPAAVRIMKNEGTFEILGATVSDPDFAVDATAAEDGRGWDVTLRYVGGPDRHGPVRAMVTITTDEPVQKTLTVDVTGKL